ncbi:unnamed protein product [Amaranthus hypochondriacus]
MHLAMGVSNLIVIYLMFGASTLGGGSSTGQNDCDLGVEEEEDGYNEEKDKFDTFHTQQNFTDMLQQQPLNAFNQAHIRNDTSGSKSWSIFRNDARISSYMETSHDSITSTNQNKRFLEEGCENV